MRRQFLSLTAILALSAGAALAQADICADHPGLLLEAPADGPAQPAAQMLSVVSRTDGSGGLKTAIALSEPATLRFEAAPLDGGDPELSVFDATGALIASDDDGGGDLASRIETALEPGAYCVTLRNLAGSASEFELRVADIAETPLTRGAQSVAAQRACLPETEALALAEGPIDAALDATGVQLSTSADRAPYMRFSIGTAQILTIGAENVAADPSIALYNANGVQIAANDDFNGLNARLDLPEPLEPGEYCLALSALNDPTAPIEVSIVRFDEASYFADLYSSGAASPPMDGDFPIQALGAVRDRMSRDIRVSQGVVWFSFELDAPSLLDIRALAMLAGVDGRLVLHEAGGRLIEENDDYDELNPRMAPILAEGTYLLGVGVLGDNAGPMRLTLRRFVEAE